MVTEFGMSEMLGAVNYNGHKRGAFLDTPFMQERGNYSEDTALKIDSEVKRIIGEATQYSASRCSASAGPSSTSCRSGCSKRK